MIQGRIKTDILDSAPIILALLSVSVMYFTKIYLRHARETGINVSPP